MHKIQAQFIHFIIHIHPILHLHFRVISRCPPLFVIIFTISLLLTIFSHFFH